MYMYDKVYIYICIIYIYNHLGFIPGMIQKSNNFTYCINRLKVKYHAIISNDRERPSDKIQCSFHDVKKLTVSKQGIE